MAPSNNYYTKKKLTKIGLDGFTLIVEFYGGSGGRKGRKHQILMPNYSGDHNGRLPLPPPPATEAATIPVVGINNHNYSKANSSSGYSSRRVYQYQGYNSNYHRYSPPESHVGWTTPVVAVTAETTKTIIRGGYETVKLRDADEILMDNFKY